MLPDDQGLVGHSTWVVRIGPPPSRVVRGWSEGWSDRTPLGPPSYICMDGPPPPKSDHPLVYSTESLSQRNRAFRDSNTGERDRTGRGHSGGWVWARATMMSLDAWVTRQATPATGKPADKAAALRSSKSVAKKAVKQGKRTPSNKYIRQYYHNFIRSVHFPHRDGQHFLLFDNWNTNIKSRRIRLIAWSH